MTHTHRISLVLSGITLWPLRPLVAHTLGAWNAAHLISLRVLAARTHRRPHMSCLDCRFTGMSLGNCLDTTNTTIVGLSTSL